MPIVTDSNPSEAAPQNADQPPDALVAYERRLRHYVLAIYLVMGATDDDARFLLDYQCNGSKVEQLEEMLEYLVLSLLSLRRAA
jgi:hypothetical protein